MAESGFDFLLLNVDFKKKIPFRRIRKGKYSHEKQNFRFVHKYKPSIF